MVGVAGTRSTRLSLPLLARLNDSPPPPPPPPSSRTVGGRRARDGADGPPAHGLGARRAARAALPDVRDARLELGARQPRRRRLPRVALGAVVAWHASSSSSETIGVSGGDFRESRSARQWSVARAQRGATRPPPPRRRRRRGARDEGSGGRRRRNAGDARRGREGGGGRGSEEDEGRREQGGSTRVPRGRGGHPTPHRRWGRAGVAARRGGAEEARPAGAGGLLVAGAPPPARRRRRARRLWCVPRFVGAGPRPAAVSGRCGASSFFMSSLVFGARHVGPANGQRHPGGRPRRRAGKKRCFRFFRHPTTGRLRGRFFKYVFLDGDFNKFPTTQTPTRRDMRRAWPAALNARDTETTPVVRRLRPCAHPWHTRQRPAQRAHHTRQRNGRSCIIAPRAQEASEAKRA